MIPDSGISPLEAITPRIAAESDGTHVIIVANITTLSGNPVPPGLTAHATFRGAAIDLTRGNGTLPTGQPTSSFSALVDVTAQPVVEGEAVDVSVDLEGHHATSSAAFPPPFAIDAVTGSLMSSPLVVTWSPSGAADPLAWSATATSVSNHTCTVSAPGVGPIADAGSLSIDSSMVVVHDNGFPCVVTFTLDRWRPGTVAPDFVAGASVEAHQTRTFWPAPS